ncbi:MAG: 30S ribosomal protein S8 [Acholeplasmatales bacterium]|nr:30S ribosomal protein S8 [Acholeplasmatales bacterium]
MSMTDPIADMLTRIRNANNMRHETVSMPASKVKTSILEVLVKEGYIDSYKNETNDNKTVTTVTLKYAQGQSVIRGLKRVSKVGLRVYAKADELPQVLNGLGTAIISTSNGMMSDRDARKANLGGEVIAYIW